MAGVKVVLRPYIKLWTPHIQYLPAENKPIEASKSITMIRRAAVDNFKAFHVLIIAANF